MLASLTIKQFALIEKLHLELDAGMTVFTGETGAGKSMLVGALGAVFGARASTDWVRHGADKTEVTAVWQAGEHQDARINALLEAADIDVEDELILRRTVNREGRSRAYINGVPVSLKSLQQIGAICLDLHGQHEHQALMQTAVQQQLLDANVAPALLADVRAAFREWQQCQSALKTLHDERGVTEQQATWMRQQLAVLQGLDIELDLAETLQIEVDGGRHHAQIQQAAADALLVLDESEPSVRDLIARASHAVEAVQDFHTSLKSSRELMEQMDALLGEMVPELRSVLDQPFDDLSLRQSEERLIALHEAMRRHDCDESGLLALMQEWQQRLAALETAGWDEAALSEKLEETRLTYCRCAAALSAERQCCGQRLVGQLRPLLDRLALAGMQIRFACAGSEQESSWSVTGWDQIGLEIQSNPGEPWRDLAAVASGGELSRLVLAFKGCGALTQMPYIAVFDEVDTGIGGETAWCVGELLAQMGRERQVLVISHLPQVAACADYQVVIDKTEQDGRTITGMLALQAEQRQQEIARMLGAVDADALKHAAAFLARGLRP